MEDEKFNVFINSVSQAFKEVAGEVTGLDFKEGGRTRIEEERTFSVIIGVTGKNNGRILFEAGASTIKVMTEAMNDGPLANITETYLYVAELANMFCGNAVTLINNKFRGSELRLTPPAIFAGTGMEITTPSIKSISTYYESDHGPVILDIGFEGM